jgi:hypothetical protein
MNFFIKLKSNLGQNINLKTEINSASYNEYDTLYLTGNKCSDKEIKFSNGEALFIGDPIFQPKTNIVIQKYLEENYIGKVIRETDGFYYLVIFNENEKKLIITGSIFNILPIYYQSTSEQIYVSSSLSLLEEQTRHLPHTKDKQYYLEKAIFNYAIFNRTPVLEIKTIPSNSYLELSDEGMRIKKHTFIHDYFVSDPAPWRKSLNYLTDVFIESTKVFFPEDRFIATLTGGFDGRTVVSLALAGNKEFETYSYGSATDPDVIIPAKVSEAIHKTFSPVILDREYADNHFWRNANKFLFKSYGSGNISRAHYHYALETRLNKSRYLLTGNFGSEILRSMKAPGVMTSGPLFNIFKDNNLATFKLKLKNYPGLPYLNSNLIDNFLGSLIEEISVYLKELPDGLTANQKFYIYMFEEVFRKYFGPEIIIQKDFIHNRSPFLNFTFIEEVLKTELAGANSSFMEKNPWKRYHGQVLYAHILKRTYPRLLDLPLDRGYCPRDFITNQGPLRIALSYIKKNYFIKRDKNTPSYATLPYELNMPLFRKIDFDGDIFNKSYFVKQMDSSWEYDQMHFSNLLSAAIFCNSIKGTYHHA